MAIKSIRAMKFSGSLILSSNDNTEFVLNPTEPRANELKAATSLKDIEKIEHQIHEKKESDCFKVWTNFLTCR